MTRDEIDKSLERESSFFLPAEDGKKIFVLVNRAGETPSDKAIVIGHGLTGKPEDYLHMVARDYFNDRGYDVYRLAFYRDETGCRRLHESTLSIHAADLNAVLDHVRGNHKKLYVCGHSLGGLAMVFATPQADAISFWDPSYQPSRRWLLTSTLSENGQYYERTGRYRYTLGLAMIEEIRTFSREAAQEMCRKISAPSQILIAGSSWLSEDPHMLFDDLVCEKEKYEIKGASHCFDTGKTVLELVEKTYQWFERF